MTLPNLIDKLKARAPDFAAAIVAALLAGKLALVVTDLAAGRRHTVAAHGPATAEVPVQSGVDAQNLLGAHLFGAAPVADGPIQATTVPLVLTGTLAGPDPTRGFAIIGENPAAARLYSAGSMLPAGVRLIEVYPEHVILDRNGVRESLSLPRQMLASGVQMPAREASDVPLVENVQKLIAQEPALVGQVLRPQPVFANGQLRGFRLYPGTDRGRFARLGLQPGDMITQVNNVPIADPQHGMDILKTLGTAASATVTVERNGASQQITIDGAKLSAAAASSGPESSTAAPAPPPPEVE